MRANYPRSHTGKKKDEILARYVNEYIALCIVYGAERTREILQERHEWSKDNGILLDSNQQQI